MKSENQIIEWIVKEISTRLSIAESEINIEDPFFNLGLSSLDVVEISADIEDWLDIEFEETLFFEYTTIRALSAYLAQESPVASDESSAINSELNNKEDPIAIIGMSCKFPGASSLSDYWNLLMNHKSAIQEVNEDHFERPLGFKSHAGLLKDDFFFDRSAFKISKEELKHMDPQQKHLLALSWQTIEDAGYSPIELANSKTSVFIGISTSDFAFEKIQKTNRGNVYDGTGFAHSIAANRLSYFFDFKGPSVSLDTACSSSLVALHHAILSLRNDEANMSLVGGINLMMSPFLMESFHKANMLSPSGKCSTFSKEADGYVRGEGGAVILLKPLSKAIKDGNNIYSIIKGSAVNQDGQTSSLTAPNITSQVEVLKSALESSRLNIDDIQYIEAHGTGTPLGDPIEVEAINRVYKKKSNKLYIGSVKTNIGHLEAAAGIASIIKASLSIKNNTIPAQINFTEINPKIKINKHSIDILKDNFNMPLEKGKYIGVSSFGFGGTNSHVILGQAPAKKENFNIDSNVENLSLYPIIISASNIDSLKDSLIGIFEIELNLELLSKELIYRFNNNLSYFFCVSVKSKKELNKVINEVLKNPEESIHTTINSKNNLSKISFVLTGQGSEYCQMGLPLYENFFDFRTTFDLIIEKFQDKIGDINLLKLWKSNQELIDIKYSQVVLFCYQVSYIELLKSFNIEVELVVGHSFGEITASYICGMLSLNDSIDLIIKRSDLVKDAPQGKMLVVYESLSKLNSIINIDDRTISLAVSNAEKINVLSGTDQFIVDAQKALKENNIKSKIINPNNAFHSYVFDNLIDSFEKDLIGMEHLKTHKKLLSCFNGNSLDVKPNQYWSRHLRSTVNFSNTLKQLFTLKPSHIIEIGPRATLMPLIKVNMKEANYHDASILTTDLSSNSCVEAFYNIIFSLQNYKHPISWMPFLKGHSRIYQKIPISQIKTITKDIKKSNCKVNNIQNTNTQVNYKETLINMISEEIDISPNQIKSDAPLIELGADSLILLSCLDLINERFDVDISMADVFSDLSTIDNLSDYLEKNVSRLLEVESSQLTSEKDKELNLKNPQHNDDIKDLIKDQLNIMAQQLKILEKSSSSKGHLPLLTPKISTKDLKNNEQKSSGMGVLGNFESHHRKTYENNSDYINSLVNAFNKKTPKSKSHTQKYRTQLADNRVSAGFRPNMKEAVYPIHFKKAKGAYFWDIDDNKFIDFTMGFGVNLFGHSPDFINNAIKEQLENGIAVGPQSDLAGPVAELLCETTGMERAAFLNSGTEAVMMALRLARAKTKREIIVIFEGSYHGHFDGVLARKNNKGESIPVAVGVPSSLTKDIIVLDYNKSESLNYIKNHAHMLAAVLIEGVQSRFPELRPTSFIKQLSEITSTSKTALIVDEVINGFRVHPKGIQGKLNFKADISIYGKILGGGFPIGAVAGSREYLDFIDGGDWQFGDNSYPKNEITFFAGTFCKHPLAMTAAFEVLKIIKKSGQEISNRLNLKTERLAKELNSFFKANDITISIVFYGSLFRFKSKMNIDWLIYNLNLEGFYIWEGRNMFLSTAHSDNDILSFIKTIKEIVHNYSNDEHLDFNKSQKNTFANDIEQKTINMIAPQYRFTHKTDVDIPYDKLSDQIALCIEFKGELNTQILKNAITSSCSRYDSFGAYYDTEKKSINFKNHWTPTVGSVDFSSASNIKELATKWLLHNATCELNPNKDPIKIDILKLSNNHYYISLICHHLTTDGLSIAFMTDDFSKAYNALIENKKVKFNKLYPFSQYMQDYSERFHKIIEAQSFWEKKLVQLPKNIWKKTSKKGARLRKVINEDSYKRIRTFGYKNKSSLQNTLFNFFCECLAEKYSLDELIIGLPAAGHTSIKETSVGQCVNIIPIRWKKLDLPINQKIGITKEELLNNYKYRDYPISKMEEFTKSKFIEVLFNVEPITELPKFQNIETNLIRVPISASEYPIMINAMRLGNSLHIEIDYQQECLSHIEAQKLLEDFVGRLLSL